MAVKKRGLGRGLDALLSGPTVSSLEEQAVKVDQSELQHLPLDLIQRGKYQPRRDMDPQALEELASLVHTKRWSLFRMKRAEPHQRIPGGLQLHLAAD